MATCRYVVLVAILVGLTDPVAAAQPCDALARGVIHLFNGKDLTGFYTHLRGFGRDNDPKGVFSVQDGLLRISGEVYGCITTRESFSDYRLIVEYKWGPKTWPPRVKRARDSGVLLHSVGTEHAYGGVWLYSIECQLIEGGTGDFIVVGDKSDRYAVTCPVAEAKQGSSYVYDPKGKPVTIYSGRINWFGRDPAWRDVKGFRGPRDVERPVGRWNRLECVADGETITVILNGVTVNRCIKAKPCKGRIQIQSEGAEIFLRRVDLIPLDRNRGERDAEAPRATPSG